MNDKLEKRTPRTPRQRDELREYVADLYTRGVIKTDTSAADVATWATENLKFRVEVADITRIIGSGEGVQIQHEFPGSAAARKGRTAITAINELVGIVAAQMAWMESTYPRLVNAGIPVLPLPKIAIASLKELVAAAERDQLNDVDLREPEER